MNTKYKVQEGYYTFDQAKRKFAFLTKSEVEKMLRETEYHFDSERKEGVFTYPDGREIRLPANGYKYSDGTIRNAGKEGCYWLMDDRRELIGATLAWYLYFGGYNAYLYDSGARAVSFSVYGIVQQ